MSQRRLPHNQDLLIGSLLVVFFIVFGMVLCFAVIQPVLLDERVFTLFGGIFLGFAMTVGAVQIAQFQGRDRDNDRVDAL
jgi:RsiW-degrading membrane proteinase PrsW (M82 family)